MHEVRIQSDYGYVYSIRIKRRTKLVLPQRQLQVHTNNSDQWMQCSVRWVLLLTTNCFGIMFIANVAAVIMRQNAENSHIRIVTRINNNNWQCSVVLNFFSRISVLNRLVFDLKKILLQLRYSFCWLWYFNSQCKYINWKLKERSLIQMQSIYLFKPSYTKNKSY